MDPATNPPEHIVSHTESVCPECLTRISARRVQVGNDIYLDKTCPEHGNFRTIIWRGTPSFEEWVRPKIPKHPQHPFTPIAQGCPYDCGLCPDHRQQTCTALLEVTARCDLSCAFCFANSGAAKSKNGNSDPSLQTIRFWYDRLLQAGGPYNVQLSGGEPTVRDDLPTIIELGRSLGFDFIQLNTNGLRIGTDASYAQGLKDAGLSSIFLQFDGITDDIHRLMRGRSLMAQKVVAIERCADLGIGVILVPTLVPDINTHQIGDIVRFGLERIPTVRGVHFQPVSYFGRYPENPQRKTRFTIPDVIRAIEEQTQGAIGRGCFKPPGCENSLCSFHGNFMRMQGGELRPLTRHQECCCPPDPLPAEIGAAKAIDFVARNWSAAPELSAASDLSTWDNLIQQMQTQTFCVSGMAFQDAWTLDLERLRDCCIHTVSPDGRLIPFCAYNLTDRHGRALYRPNPDGIGEAS
jgi:7,8-dihydro-6-hydroxymethylpterin dimethyltransferase